MGKGIQRFLLSSLGKKLVMGLTGLLLVGFLIAHLAGNLTLYADSDGSKFIEYASGLHDLGPLLWIAELGLLLLFAVHIWMAVLLTRENREARPRPYVVKKTFGRSTAASRTMFVTGSVVLGFVVIHLANFRFSQGIAAPHADELHQRVINVLSSPFWGAVYVVGAVAVGVHVSHGFKSAFQSWGVNHPRLNRVLRTVGVLLAVVFALGFASFPLIAMMAWRGNAV